MAAWRTYGLAHGLTKSLSVPLPTSTGAPLGALNLYSISAAKLTQDDHDAAVVFAAQAAGAVMVAIRLAEQAELLDQLERALESRAVINQAKGVVMAQEHCTADQAFAILRTASQRRNTKLRDLARAIVTRVGIPDPGSSDDNPGSRG
ncbi:MAG: ANTAR domain-containing protein [Streptosporangiales bacterium]|nr:ANTAR domain-containing protein [Streptosporangiales bacterium]